MLKITQIRYEFSAREPLLLHHDIPVITFRGAFGYALAQVLARQAGIPELEEQVSVFRKIFMPQNSGEEESRNLDLTRPFILRGAFTRPDRRSFLLDTFLFGKTVQYENFFDCVLETIAYMGLGSLHQECHLQKIFAQPVKIPESEPKPFLTVHFRSPCSRLKSEGIIFHDEIPFYALFARLFDRCCELNSLYGEPEDSFFNPEEGQKLKQLAKEIAWKKLSGGAYRANRISGRTQDHIRMDGFTGEMIYHGDFLPFQNYLRYLPYIGVGRFSVFGCGWCDLKYTQTEPLKKEIFL